MKRITLPLIRNTEHVVEIPANHAGGSDLKPAATILDRAQAQKLRDQLDKILGDRGEYTAPELPSCLSVQERAEIRVLAEHALFTAHVAAGLTPPEIRAAAHRVIAALDRLIGDPPPDVEAVLFGALVSFGEFEDGTAICKLNVPGECYRERIRELARGVAKSQPSPALSPDEAAAIRECARVARAWSAARTPNEQQRLTGQAGLALGAVERLSGAPGPPEGDDRPADAEALAALVDEAVDRRVGGVKAGLARQLRELRGRVQALELHRAGLTDGQAEAVP